jgi:outer membrane protein
MIAHRTARSFAILLAALAPVVAAAQQGTPPAPAPPPTLQPALPQPAARPITLSEAARLADRNAPQAVQARGQIRTANAARKSAYAAFIPSLSLSASTAKQLPARERTDQNSGLRIAADPWAQGQRFNASVDLFNGSRFYDIRAASAQIGAAEAGELSGRYQVRLQVAQQYYASLAARESEEAAEAQLAQAAQQLRVAVAKVQARTATRSDSLRARIQVGQAQLALLNARTQRITADAQLTRLVASQEPVTAAPADTATARVEPLALPDSATLVRLVEQGPAVQQARANVTAARAQSRAARAPYLPTVSVGYSTNVTGTTRNFAFVSGDPTQSGQLSFSLSYQLFNQWSREEGVVRADIAEDNAEATLRDARLGAQQQLVAALGTLRLAEQQAEIQAATVVASEEDLRVQQQRYELGAATLLDVLTSQTQLVNARTALIQARLDARVARAQIEALIGRDLGTAAP